MQIVEAWRRQRFIQFILSRDKQFKCALSVFLLSAMAGLCTFSTVTSGKCGSCRGFTECVSLRAEIRKYRESADRSEKSIFFLFSPKEHIWLAIFRNDIKRFDFFFLYSKFAKPENSATGPSTAAMRLEIWHMFNTLVRTHQMLS